MKHIKLILILIFYHIILISGFAQNPDLTTVKFSYDLNGNRVLRWIDITKIAIPDTADSLQQDSLIKKNIANSGVLNGMISLFPNPTGGLRMHDLGLHTQFIGEIMDVKVEDGFIGEGGKPDVEIVKPFFYVHSGFAYYRVGKMIGKAFTIGNEI